MRTLRLLAWVVIVTGAVMVARSLRLVERLTVWRDIAGVWSHQPPFSTAPFWQFETAVVTRRSDDRLAAAIKQALGDRLNAQSVRQYQALPLQDYLRARGAQIGSGPFLTITNIRGERIYLTQTDIEQQQPVIVIGLDNERQLFRMYGEYRTSREYSWQEEGATPPWSVRPLGAFLYYPAAPPARLDLRGYAAYGLVPEGFVLSEEDPLAAVRGVPAPVAGVLFGTTEGCLTCHALGGVGAKSHHTNGITAQPQGGYGLPLESYDPEVMRRFLFDQKSVAKTMGVSPLMVDEATAALLLEAVARHRQR
jgi:hypothetical protein